MFVFDQELLSHPLVLLIIGAAISGVIIPYATDKWKDKQKQLEIARQDYQRELAIKNDLVADIAQSVMIILVTMKTIQKRIDDVGQICSKQHEFDKNQQPTNNIKLVPNELPKLMQSINVSFEKLDKKYNDFEISSGVIGTTLKIYFPESHLYDRWRNFYTKKMNHLYEKTRQVVEAAKKGDFNAFDTECWSREAESIFNEKVCLIEDIISPNTKILRK
jgi:methyl-accepting chemotaxis protein